MKSDYFKIDLSKPELIEKAVFDRSSELRCHVAVFIRDAMIHDKSFRIKTLENVFYEHAFSATLVTSLLKKVKEYCNERFFNLFKELNPDPYDVMELLINVKEFRTPENIRWWKNMNPTKDLVHEFFMSCPDCRNKKITAILE